MIAADESVIDAEVVLEEVAEESEIETAQASERAIPADGASAEAALDDAADAALKESSIEPREAPES